jgi:hypothetical protein
MSRECVFCCSYERGIEFPCCDTYVCDSCIQGEGFTKKGDGGIMFPGLAQVMCPADGVWVDA